MSALHTTMAQGKWDNLLLAEKMGNIGSEIARARSADERGDIKRRDASIGRASELIQLTVFGLSAARGRELARLLNAIAGIKNNSTDIRLQSIEQYCMPFALLARRNT